MTFELVEPINSHTGSAYYGFKPGMRLWKPLKVGDIPIEHRIFLAPLTRYRAIGQIPCESAAKYYSQRATKGGLLITEGTFISKEASGYPNAPGIFTNLQVEQWRKITEAVHEKGGIIFCQLWNIGVMNDGEMADVPIIGPGTVNVKLEPNSVKMMSAQDIKKHLQDYRHATEMAMSAGFDGVEVHGAHGYLLEQFLHPSLNNTRSDEYSSESLENSSRFMLQALQAVVEVVGEKKAAIRISPFSSMYLNDYDPFETFGYVCREIKKRFPNLAYVSLTDPRWNSNRTKEYSNDYFRAIFRGVDESTVSKTAIDASTVFPEPNEHHPTVILSAGGNSVSDGEFISERTGDIVGFGRLFISNPDLVHRIRNGLVLNAYDRSTFYSQTDAGYIDYPEADETTEKFVPINQLPPGEAAQKLSSELKKQRKHIAKIVMDSQREKTALQVKIATLEKTLSTKL